LMRGGHGGFGESQSFGERPDFPKVSFGIFWSLGISGRLCSRSRSLTRLYIWYMYSVDFWFKIFKVIRWTGTWIL
jgi:hypothetical protein